MIVIGLLIYLGILAGVSAWFYILCGYLCLAQIIKFGWGLYKKGKEAAKK